MRVFSKIAVILLVASGLSCTEDIADCPGKMCIVAESWRLTLVYVNDELYSGDLSGYRLVLHTPEPRDASEAGFDRTQISGSSDTGTWSIQNNETVLRLIPANDPLFTENWIIESFSPRKLILVMNRDISFKQGPQKIRLVLEPA